MRLVNPSRTSALLRKSGFRFIRDLGQNFLVDPNTMDKILNAAGLQSKDVVLEIGTGIGTLTVELAERVAAVITVEIDRRLDPILAETLAPFTNIKRLAMDAMRLTASDVTVEGRKPDKLVANLPYGIAAPVVLRVLTLLPGITNMTVMVQREAADRMLARPDTRDYSAFTVKLAYYCRVERIMAVSRNVFMPPPNVDSAVVRLTRWEEPPVKSDRDRLFSLITAGFSQRRKRLANAVGSSTAYKKEAVDAALRTIGLPPGARAETLSLAEFGKLLEELEK
jgi:16S rRNA (adenine1518-N6/adenine1519-N6)-dimethyltransferase